MIRSIVLGAVFGGGSLGWGYDFTTNLSTKLPIKWPAGPIPLQVKVDSTTVLPGDGSTRASSIQAAAQVWNTHLGAVQFQPAVLAAGSAGYANGVTEVVFANSMFGQSFDARTLAVTFLRSNGNAATERDVIFNSNLAWDSYRGSLAQHPGVWDVQRVAVHELGHVLGLDHPDQAAPAQTVAAIMNSVVSNVIVPVDDDISGAQVLYGPPGIPANDSFSAAIPLALSNNAARVTGHNTNATKEVGEPLHAANAGGRSVWWQWTAPGSGIVSLDTKGSVFDTTLGVYQGSALASLTVVASSDDLEPGVIQYSTLSFPASAGTTYHFGIDGFDGDSGLVVLNLALAPDAGSAPVVLTPPASRTVAVGSGVTFAVVVAGTPAPTYQWFKDGNPLTGATEATLVLAGVQPADSGQYAVRATNAAGSVTSAAAALTVVDVRATHAVVGPGYLAGGTVTLAQTLTYSGPCTGLDWQMNLPLGWSYASGSGAEGGVRPAVGATSYLEWTWTTVPSSPVTFSVTLKVPAGESGDKILTAAAVFGLASGVLNLSVSPASLVVAPVPAHSADLNRDFRLSLAELLRVIELYTTHYGTVRTGSYRVDSAGEDGFAAEPARPATAAVGLARYHSADSNRDGRLSLLELTRVIEYYLIREGSTRTGQYRWQAGTEDGFAPGR